MNTFSIRTVRSFSFALCLAWLLVSGASLAHAQSLVAVPAIIDLEGQPRDILKASVTLDNRSETYIEVYPFINSISAEYGRQEFVDPATADSASSLANWIELSRASIILKAREKKTIEFAVNVHLRAQPGNYHAVVSFARGSTRDEAERNLRNALQVPVNVEVLENIKERLQLKRFAPHNVFSAAFPVLFDVVIANVGNREVMPTGEMRIYDRKGEEVAILPVQSPSSIAPGTTLSLTVAWDEPNPDSLLAKAGLGIGDWGRYKALVDLEYGSSGRGTVQDTVFFWVLPWHVLLIVFLVVTLSMVAWIRRLHRRHMRTYDA